MDRLTDEELAAGAASVGAAQRQDREADAVGSFSDQELRTAAAQLYDRPLPTDDDFWGGSPDDIAGDQRRERERGYPRPDNPEMRKIFKEEDERLAIEELLRSAPATRRAMANPEVSAVARDQVRELALSEQRIMEAVERGMAERRAEEQVRDARARLDAIVEEQAAIRGQLDQAARTAMTEALDALPDDGSASFTEAFDTALARVRDAEGSQRERIGALEQEYQQIRTKAEESGYFDKIDEIPARLERRGRAFPLAAAAGEDEKLSLMAETGQVEFNPSSPSEYYFDYRAFLDEKDRGSDAQTVRTETGLFFVIPEDLRSEFVQRQRERDRPRSRMLSQQAAIDELELSMADEYYAPGSFKGLVADAAPALVEQAPRMAAVALGMPWLAAADISSAGLAEGYVRANDRDRELRAEGKPGLPQETKIAAAALYAAAEVGPEMASIGAVLQAIARTRGLVRVAAGAATATSSEFLSEAATSLAQSGVDVALLDSDRSVQEVVDDAFRDGTIGALTGFALGVGTGVVGEGAGQIRRRQEDKRRRVEEKQLANDQEALRQAAEMEQITQSLQEGGAKLRERSPEAAEAHAAEVLRGTAKDQMHIDVADIEEATGDGLLFQNSDDADSYFESKLGLPRETLKRARERRAGAISFPTAKFLTRVAGTDAETWFLDHYRAAPDAESRADAQNRRNWELQKRTLETVETTLDEFEARLASDDGMRMLHDHIVAQQVALKHANGAAVFGQGEAQQNAAMFSQIYARLAAEMNASLPEDRQVTPLELYTGRSVKGLVALDTDGEAPMKAAEPPAPTLTPGQFAAKLERERRARERTAADEAKDADRGVAGGTGVEIVIEADADPEPRAPELVIEALPPAKVGRKREDLEAARAEGRLDETLKAMSDRQALAYAKSLQKTMGADEAIDDPRAYVRAIADQIEERNVGVEDSAEAERARVDYELAVQIIGAEAQRRAMPDGPPVFSLTLENVAPSPMDDTGERGPLEIEVLPIPDKRMDELKASLGDGYAIAPPQMVPTSELQFVHESRDDAGKRTTEIRNLAEWKRTDMDPSLFRLNPTVEAALVDQRGVIRSNAAAMQRLVAAGATHAPVSRVVDAPGRNRLDEPQAIRDAVNAALSLEGVAKAEREKRARMAQGYANGLERLGRRGEPGTGARGTPEGAAAPDGVVNRSAETDSGRNGARSLESAQQNWRLRPPGEDDDGTLAQLKKWGPESDQRRLSLAQRMIATRRHPVTLERVTMGDIWRMTGFRLAEDGEIEEHLSPDDLMIREDVWAYAAQGPVVMALGEFADYPSLFAIDRYASLRYLPVAVAVSDGEIAGQITPNGVTIIAPTPEVAREMLIEEIQHGMDRIDGRPAGSNEERLRASVERAYRRQFDVMIELAATQEGQAALDSFQQATGLRAGYEALALLMGRGRYQHLSAGKLPVWLENRGVDPAAHRAWAETDPAAQALTAVMDQRPELMPVSVQRAAVDAETGTFDDHGAYRRSSGEARAGAAIIGSTLSPEQRRETDPSDWRRVGADPFGGAVEGVVDSLLSEAWVERVAPHSPEGQMRGAAAAIAGLYRVLVSARALGTEEAIGNAGDRLSRQTRTLDQGGIDLTAAQDAINAAFPELGVDLAAMAELFRRADGEMLDAAGIDQAIAILGPVLDLAQAVEAVREGGFLTILPDTGSASGLIPRGTFERPEFREFFGESKAVDAEGKPLVVYHGTMRAFSAFDMGEATEGAVFFSDSPSVANHYAGKPLPESYGEDRRNRTVIPGFVRLENPYEVDFGGAGYASSRMQKIVDAARAGGHDGIIVRNINDVSESGGSIQNQYAVFDRSQFKSTFSLNFDRADPRYAAMAARTVEGSLTDENGEALDPTDDPKRLIRAAKKTIESALQRQRVAFRDGEHETAALATRDDEIGEVFIDEGSGKRSGSVWKATDTRDGTDKLFAYGRLRELIEGAENTGFEDDYHVRYDRGEFTPDESVTLEKIEKKRREGVLGVYRLLSAISVGGRTVQIQLTIQRKRDRASGMIRNVFYGVKQLGEREVSRLRAAEAVRTQDPASPAQGEDTGARTEYQGQRSKKLTLKNPPDGELNQNGRADRGVVRGHYNPNSKIIALTNAKNFTTFLHEGMHAVVDLYRQVAEMPDGPQRIKDDYAKMLRYAGVRAADMVLNPDDSDAQAQKRKARYTMGHERLTQAFELYLREGKAPVRWMRDVFARIANWFVSTYGALTKIFGGQSLLANDVDMRRIFDRMLATEEQLADEARAMGFHRLTGTAADYKLSASEWRVMQGATDRAMHEATERAIAAAAAMFGDEASRIHEQRVAEEIPVQRDRLSKTPVYRALIGFQEGRVPPLSRPEIEEAFPELDLSKAPRGVLTAKTPEPLYDDLDAAAADLGFDGPREMIEVLLGQARDLSKRKAASATLLSKGAKRLRADQIRDLISEIVFNGGEITTPLEKLLPRRGRRTVYAIPSDKVSDPEMVARWAGFTTRDGGALAMLEAVLSAPPLDQAAEAAAREAMAATDPANKRLDTGRIIELLHGEASMFALEEQIKALARGADATGVNRRNAKVIARERMGQEPVGLATRLSHWLGGERRAASRAAEAQARLQEAADKPKSQLHTAGLMTAVLAWKESQLLHMAMVAESRKVEGELRRLERKAERLKKQFARLRTGNPGEIRKNTIAPDYLEQIESLLHTYMLANVSKKRMRELQNYNAWRKSMIDAGREAELVDVPDRLLNLAGRTRVQDLTVDEMRGLVEAIANLEHLGRTKEKLKKEARAREIERKVETLSEGIAKRARGARGNPRREGSKTTGERRARMVASGWMSLMEAATIIEAQIDDGDSYGAGYQLIAEPIDKAFRALGPRLRSAATRWNDLNAVYSKKEWAKMDRNQIVPGADLEMSHTDRLAFALNWGNEGNREAIRQSERYKGQEDRIKAILGTLDQRDWQYVQSVWDYLEEFRPELAAKEKRLTGVEPVWVDAVPVETTHGTFRGGYYPLRYGDSVSYGTFDPDPTESGNLLDPRNGLRRGKAGTKRDHSKTRVGSNARPVLFDLNVAYQHVNSVIYDLAMGEAVADVSSILSDRRFAEAMTGAGREAGLIELQNWIRDIADGEIAVGDGYSQAFRALRTNWTFAKLAWSLTTVAIQPTGLIQSWAKLGLTKSDIWVGLGQALNPTRVAQIYRDSEIMRQRAEAMNKEVADAQKNNRTNVLRKLVGRTVGDGFVDLGYMMMAKVQQIVDIPTYLAAYRQGLGKGLSQERAVLYAEKIVQESQGASTFARRSGWERGSAGNAKQSEFIKTWSVLMSYMALKPRMIYLKAAEITHAQGVAGKAVATADLMATAVMIFWVEAVVTLMVRELLRGDDWWEEQDDPVRAVAAAGIMSALGSMPGTNLFAADAAGFRGGAAFTLAVADLGKLWQQVEQGEPDIAAMKTAVNAFSLVTPIPSSQINRSLEAGLASMEDEDVRWYEMFFGLDRD